jgi:hypothetical protein
MVGKLLRSCLQSKRQYSQIGNHETTLLNHKKEPQK